MTSRVELRHCLATLAYRAGKAVRGAPPEFSDFRASERCRTPSEIMAHMTDLMHWGIKLAEGQHVWKEVEPLPYAQEAERFFAALVALDAFLASDKPLGWTAERIFQGPIADALTHVGQLTMLRGLAGNPVRGENYAKAEITAGRAGADQAPPVYEFD